MVYISNGNKKANIWNAMNLSEKNICAWMQIHKIKWMWVKNRMNVNIAYKKEREKKILCKWMWTWKLNPHINRGHRFVCLFNIEWNGYNVKNVWKNLWNMKYNMMSQRTEIYHERCVNSEK